MRLIDADALDEALTALRFTADGELAHWGDRKDWCLHGSEIEMLIANAPTVEAEPVRHGKWTVTYLKHIELANDEGHVYIHFAKCSECGNEAIMQFVDYNESFKEWYTDYCPNCGAKMEEE